MFGISADGLAGSSMFDRFHASDRTSLQRMADRILTGQGSTFRSEKRYVWPDESVFWGDVSISTVHAPDDDEKIEGLIWIVVGITDRRRAVDSLRALNERLRVIGDADFNPKGGVRGARALVQVQRIGRPCYLR